MDFLLGKFGMWIIFIGLPIVHAYHMLCENIFLNMASKEAEGIERLASFVLSPTHYVLGGKEVQKQEWGYSYTQRFTYGDHFLLKSAVSTIALPLSASIGATLKAVAYLTPETRKRHRAIVEDQTSLAVRSNLDFYRQIGINIQESSQTPFIEKPSYTRRPGDEKHLQQQKEALKEIVAILKARQIPFWVDCGTCLGSLRYGGIIPWDWDLDVAVLAPDFENVKHALNALDKNKYVVQDWSGRDKPGSYLKVYIKGLGREGLPLIDIYHFSIDTKSPFLSEKFKNREQVYTVATPFDTVFPLKKAYFDGIEVLVPGKTKEYLQGRYGADISPVKVYDPITGQYEKDASHPYWQNLDMR
jgi:hypothetical protein